MAAVVPPRREAAASASPQTVFKAPLLGSILAGEESESRRVVLDFGSASQTLIDRLVAVRPTRLEVCDFVGNGELSAFSKAEPEDLPVHARHALPDGNDEPLDLILLWDLPNYLSLKSLQVLVAVVSERAARNCKLHMLIAYSRREMPEHPARYVPEGESGLRQLCDTSVQTAAPRYSPEDLNLACGGFRYQKGVLLANGMQEFVYTWPE